MPTYQYACTECGHQLEAVQSFSDAPLSECPVCQGRLRKLFNSVGIVFKGSGFYRTDSRGGSTSSEASGASSSESKPAETKKPAETQSSSKSGADSKPAAAPAASSTSSSSTTSTAS
ncbi:FmdB family zinc ribbon protein [Catenuloplanes japonicus]|uniref:FmdB family zinc ribbon protein n=1 Tax=Catenuloplanes japonicus TaxID=33876 RepID=UPI000A122D8C|nr:FmdB family zinc ribbon protein [Catenuloplanes japonicus]